MRIKGVPIPGPTRMVRIYDDDVFDGCALPAREVLINPAKVFNKRERAGGEGKGEFTTGARCRVVGTREAYQYDGKRWLPVEVVG